MSALTREEKAAAVMRRWASDPVAFCVECLSVTPDAWQAVALRRVCERERVLLSASKGVGKTSVLAWACWWFLATRPHAQILMASITGDNLRDGLMKELAYWRAKSPYLQAQFRVTSERVEHLQHAQTWFASARSWPKGADSEQQASTLAGFHADRSLVILDEIGDYPHGVIAAAEASLSTGTENRMLCAGNSTDTEGALGRIVMRHRDAWGIVEVNGDPDNPLRSPRVSLEWAKKQIAEWGRDHPYVLVNVLGKFPPAKFNALLGYDEVVAATRRPVAPRDYEWAQKRLGVDVARFGDDSTVLFPRQGLQAFLPVVMRNARTGDIAGRVMLAREAWGQEVEYVDDTGGYGAGVVDALIHAGRGPVAVNASSKADDDRFLNRRAECYWRMAEWIKRGGCIPNDDDLIRQLCAPTYTYRNGRLMLEPKEMIKERLGFSPDKADALALTFAQADLPGAVAVGAGPGDRGVGMLARGSVQTVSDWDPIYDDSREKVGGGEARGVDRWVERG